MISPKLIEFLKWWEGERGTGAPHLAPRQDRVNPRVWDYGFGHVCDRDAPPLKSIAEAVALLAKDAAFFAAGVARLVKVPLTQQQADALTSFSFNEGLDEDHDGIAEGLGDSSLLRLLNTGDYVGAENQFKYWNESDHHVVTGLVRRREAELFIWRYGDYSKKP